MLVYTIVNVSSLNASTDESNRRLVLNYASQTAERVHDYFARVNTNLQEMQAVCEDMKYITDDSLMQLLKEYTGIWELDAAGFLYDEGAGVTLRGDRFKVDTQTLLYDVLTYSQKLALTRVDIGGYPMLMFARPYRTTVQGRRVDGLLVAVRLDKMEAFLGNLSYAKESYLSLVHQTGEMIWRRFTQDDSGDYFEALSRMQLSPEDSVAQVIARMQVNKDGTTRFFRDGEEYYAAYVPLKLNYWYVVLTMPADTIDLTILARRHTQNATLLGSAFLCVLITWGLYLYRTNRRAMDDNARLQTAMEAANEANAAKRDFLARVTHDIRTPLNGVMGMLALAREDYDDRARCMDHLDKASVSAQYLLGLLNDVLDMSRIESGKTQLRDEIVDVQRLIAECRTVLENDAVRKGLSFVEEIKLCCRYIWGDHLRLRQILTNLGSNAVKYTPTGGHIRLCVSDETDEKGQWLLLEVDDDGMGIPKEKQEMIFDPFEQLTQGKGGVGLGLSIVRKYVDLMGGAVGVNSEPGRGSAFTVRIPLRPAPEPEIMPEEAGEDCLRGVMLLLAEDNPLNAEIAIALLEDKGASVELVTDGQQAMERFHAMPPGTYHALLMDIQMPVMDGLEATRRIRDMAGRPDGATIPIIAMTANAFHEQQEEMAQAGLTDYLYKPIDIEQVCACIRKWVKKGDC